jgi:hypothetical protein
MNEDEKVNQAEGGIISVCLSSDQAPTRVDGGGRAWEPFEASDHGASEEAIGPALLTLMQEVSEKSGTTGSSSRVASAGAVSSGTSTNSKRLPGYYGSLLGRSGSNAAPHQAMLALPGAHREGDVEDDENTHDEEAPQLLPLPAYIACARPVQDNGDIATASLVTMPPDTPCNPDMHDDPAPATSPDWLGSRRKRLFVGGIVLMLVVAVAVLVVVLFVTMGGSDGVANQGASPLEPTSDETAGPTSVPTITPPPSISSSPTEGPTTSLAPTQTTTMIAPSSWPTAVPSLPPEPSSLPTAVPTTQAVPTPFFTADPTPSPTASPTPPAPTVPTPFPADSPSANPSSPASPVPTAKTSSEPSTAAPTFELTPPPTAPPTQA